MERVFERSTFECGDRMISLRKRDGMGRIGTLNGRNTPLMVDVMDKESRKFLESVDTGFAAYPLKFIDENRYETLKSRDENITVVAGLGTLNPSKIAEVLIDLRDRDWKPIYTPALATPRNIPILVYLGVDIIDNILPVIEAYSGKYMLPDSELNVNSIREFPCTCPVCSSYSPEEVRKMDYEKRGISIAKHNTFILENQIKLVREQIYSDNLRNFVESRAKSTPELAVMLRVADELLMGYKRLNSCIQRFKSSKALFTTLELKRPEILNFLDGCLKSYKPAGKTVVILPCTASKPYLTSRTHSIIRKNVKMNGVNEIIISSPLVSPRELELCYPAINYDTTVTGYWSEDEVHFVAESLSSLILNGRFEKVIAHVEGGYRKVVDKASEICGFEPIYTSEDGILSSKSIERLGKEIEESEKVEFRLYEEVFRHMARYQFGIEIEGDIRIKGKYPELTLYSGDERLMWINSKYGRLEIDYLFAFSLIRGKKYIVRVDNFELKGDIFAAGILEADSEIKPNDTVVFYNDYILGTGMAVMSGIEMVEVDRGLAIRVRRKFERNVIESGVVC